MTKKVVSILTPSYNNGGIIDRLLDSVLLQSYENIEMLVVDDGSTDHTREVIESYQSKFAERGYKLDYLYQDNAGQSAAINRGLKFVKGDYLVWPDSDDFYSSLSTIERLVNEFESRGDDVGVVRCECNFVDENSLEVVGGLELKSDSMQDSDLFMDCLLHRNNFWYVPGGYMVRVAHLDQRIVGRDIYTAKLAGQNWQLLLPVMYNMKCVTIREKLYSVLVRRKSHSRKHKGDYGRMIVMNDVYMETILSTLSRMKFVPAQLVGSFENAVCVKYLILNLRMSLRCSHNVKAKQCMEGLRSRNVKLPFKLKFYYYLPFISPTLVSLRSSVRKLRKNV